MRNIFFALIFSVFFFNEALAQSGTDRYYNECKSFVKQPKIKLVSSYGKLQYKFDKDADFLKNETAKKFKEKNMPVPENFYPVGLTKVRDLFDFNFVAGTMGLSHGYTCVFPESIEVSLEYSLPTIYILNSLEKNTCMYQLALRHEKTHMQIYVEALDYFLPILKAHLGEMFDRLGFTVVAKGDSVEDAAKKLNDKYLADIQAKLDKWHIELDTEQMKLDSPEQYRMENMLCQYLEENNMIN